jgi:pilus assembly protein Flp/PilA
MMNNFMMSFMRDEQGQDLIEYALLAGLISILCVAAITTAGSKVSALWDKVSASIP